MAAPDEWYDLAFQAAYALDDPAEAALEDYARVLARAEGAEAVRSAGSGVSGVRLRQPSAPLAPATARDIEDFAHDLATRGGGNGLGWA